MINVSEEGHDTTLDLAMSQTTSFAFYFATEYWPFAA